MKDRVYQLIVGVLLVIIITCTLGTIRSKAEEIQIRNNDTLKAEENMYRNLLQESFTREGLSNTGITMTKIFLEDGTISEYKIKIHNQKFEMMTEIEKNEILDKLEKINTSSELDLIRKEFLIWNS